LHNFYWQSTAQLKGRTRCTCWQGYAAEGRPGRYAALKCWTYKKSGFNDWYLPSRDELNKLYRKKDIVGGFQNTGYWSSSESSLFGYAWYQDFTYGTQDNMSVNNNTINVRAIRSF